MELDFFVSETAVIQIRMLNHQVDKDKSAEKVNSVGGPTAALLSQRLSVLPVNLSLLSRPNQAS